MWFIKLAQNNTELKCSCPLKLLFFKDIGPKLGAKNIKKTRKTSVNESNSKLSTKSCTTEQRNVNKPEWKKGTVLILGDSMISGIDEKRLTSNGSVKVRIFPGSTI